MARKGINPEVILDCAAKLVEEKGYDRFSLHELADRLGIKTASLYNHLNGISELNANLSQLAIERMYQAMSRAIEGKNKRDALVSAAHAYRAYAKENPELYRAIIALPSAKDDTLEESTYRIFGLFHDILLEFGLDKPARIHFARAFRSAMHGFVSLEYAGFFKREVPADESFSHMVDGLVRSLDDGCSFL